MRINSLALQALLITGLIGFVGCAPGKNRNTGANEESAEVLKWISQSIGDSDSPSSLQQSSYLISNSSRLLMKYKGLAETATTQGQATSSVRVRIHVVHPEDRATALSALRVCPLTQQWSLLATWTTAEPRIEWTPGGSVNLDDCVRAAGVMVQKPTPALPPNEPATTKRVPTSSDSLCAGEDAVCFDVTAWYNRYVIEQGATYGLALISYSGEAVEVFGDGGEAVSLEKAPRLQFDSGL
jgi:hypothetical protein